MRTPTSNAITRPTLFTPLVNILPVQNPVKRTASSSPRPIHRIAAHMAYDIRSSAHYPTHLNTTSQGLSKSVYASLCA